METDLGAARRTENEDAPQSGSETEESILGDLTAEAEAKVKHERGTLTKFVVREAAPRLIHVEYPGFVENAEKAVRTLGGIAQISDTFADPRKKLELRFRPADVYCNPVAGESSTTCGVLVRVRRKKVKDKKEKLKPTTGTSKFYSSVDESLLLKLDRNIAEPEPLSQHPDFDPELESVDENLMKEIQALRKLCPELLERAKKKDAILKEESALLKSLEERIKEEDCNARTNTKRKPRMEQVYVRLPPKEFRPSRSGLLIDVLGVVNRKYKFDGLCDFQYLQTEFDKEEKCQVSVQDSVAPVVADPDSEVLFMPDLDGPDDETPFFLVPSIMSRQNKPSTSVINFTDENRNGGDVIRSTRAKRVVYSHNINYRLTDNQLDSNKVLVPQQAMPEALADVSKRQLGKELEVLKLAFGRRPIWTKLALEAETSIKDTLLKYLVPCVAYFCLNGPWRSLWVRFGYDPRKDKGAYLYQLLDYRIPHAYRSTILLSKRNPEAYFIFKSGEVPPKCQMFYQLCDIHIPEVYSVVAALKARISNFKNIEYSPKFGFIDEDTMEYCRYCISRYIEVFLKEKGKIPAITLVELELPLGCTAPKNMVKLGLSRNPNLFRMRSRPKRKEPRKSEASSSKSCGSDTSSLAGDLTIRNDQLHDTELVEVEDEDEDWQDHVNTPISVTTTQDSFDDDDDDPVMQEILGN